MKKCIKRSFEIFTFILLAATSVYSTNIAADTTKERPTTRIKKLQSPPTSDNNFAKNCEKIEAVINIIEEAISVGAPTYNTGNHSACYLIYQGAAYKIIYLYGAKCKQVKNVLETAVEKAQGNYSSTDKAWIMRMAFDQILGVPTETK